MKTTFDAMLALVNSRELDFFTSYRDDFFVVDFNHLTKWGAPGVQYVWIVKDTGTWLARVGGRDNAIYCDCILDRMASNGTLDPERTKLFWVRDETVTQISPDQALSLLRLPPMFTIDGSHLLRNPSKKPFLLFGVTQNRGNFSASVNVRFDAVEPGPIALADLVALNDEAVAIGVREMGTMFVNIEEVRIGDVVLEKAVADARLAAPAKRKFTANRPTAFV